MQIIHNFESLLLISDSDKMKKSQQQMNKDCYNKLTKLRISINDSSDYCCLEKCMQNLEKIKTIGFSMENSKSKREITSLINSCQILIKQKIKFFKKKMRKIANSRLVSQSNIGDDNDSILKNCRSVDNLLTAAFNMNKNQSTRKNLSRTQENFQPEYLKKYDSKDTQINFQKGQYTEDGKTQFILRRSTSNKDFKTLMQEKFSSVNTQLEAFKSKIKQIEQKAQKEGQKQNFRVIFEQKNQFVLEKYERKIRQKVIQNQQLKTKNHYLQQKNEELKNRVLNQSRRQNEYIQSLKAQISSMSEEFAKVCKQRENAIQYISSLQKQSAMLNQDIKRTIKKYEEQKKKREHQIQVSKSQNNARFQEMRRQIQYLSRQQMYVKEVQKMIQAQSLEKNKLQSKYQLVLKQNDGLRNQVTQLIKQNDKREQLIETLRDQIMRQKVTIQKECIVHQKLEEQLFETKKQLIIMKQQKQFQFQEKNIIAKDKATKLKQVRQMLQELK